MAGRPARAAASADARDDGGRRHLGFTRLAERLVRSGRVGAQLLSDTLDLTFATVLAQAFPLTVDRKCDEKDTPPYDER